MPYDSPIVPAPRCQEQPASIGLAPTEVNRPRLHHDEASLLAVCGSMDQDSIAYMVGLDACPSFLAHAKDG